MRRGSGVQRARARLSVLTTTAISPACQSTKSHSAANDSTMGDAVNLATTVHAFNKILAQPKLSSRTRTPEDVEESVKKLRRLILIEGIPSRAVCARLTVADPCTLCSHLPGDLCRIPRYDTEFGKSCSGLTTCPPKHSLNMSREGPAK